MYMLWVASLSLPQSLASSGRATITSISVTSPSTTRSRAATRAKRPFSSRTPKQPAWPPAGSMTSTR